MQTDKVNFKIVGYMLMSENMEKNLQVDLRGCSIRFRVENETLIIERNNVSIFTIPVERVAEDIKYLIGINDILGMKSDGTA